MTRAKALKHVIRARAAKTGERYTAARRHVLNELAKGSGARTKRVPPQLSLVPQAARPVMSTKGGLSDAKAIEKTGYGLAHWFDVLDKFGAVEKGHTKAADHLYSVHGVPRWYCQGITVAYERARGVRGMNQRCDGSYEVTVSKVILASPLQIIKGIKAQRWTDGVDAGLVKALALSLKDKTSKGFVIRPDGQARFRYKWDGTTVQFNMYPKGPDKTSFVVSNTNLPSAEAVEAHRARWKTAFGSIADLFA